MMIVADYNRLNIFGTSTILLAVIILCAMASTCGALPASYDCREMGYVSSVKDQLGCDCCGTFTTVAMLESAILANDGALYDLSEEHAKNCVYENRLGIGGGCNGGNAKMIINIFSQTGAVQEKNSPYRPVTGGCNCDLPKEIRVTDWQMLSFENVPNPDVLKDAIMKYGPIYSSVDVKILPEKYNGELLSRTYDTWEGHGILIVGWDDSRQCWIVKNSWGTDWGDEGFGYIKYGAGLIGAFSSVITGYEMVDHNARTLYHDEGGWTFSYGWNPRKGVDNWAGMCAYNLRYYDRIQAVEFWTTGPATVRIKMFDNLFVSHWDAVEDWVQIDGLGRKIYQEEDIFIPNAGYHSIDVPSICPGTRMAAVSIYYENEGGKYEFRPFPIDSIGPLSETYDAGYDYEKSLHSWGYIKEWSSADHKLKRIGDTTIRLRVTDGEKLRVGQVSISTEGNDVLKAGETIDFKVSTSGHCSSLEWKCTNNAVGHISPDGVFTAKQNGDAVIYTMCYGTRSNSITVVVMNSTVADYEHLDHYEAQMYMFYDAYHGYEIKASDSKAEYLKYEKLYNDAEDSWAKKEYKRLYVAHKAKYDEYKAEAAYTEGVYDACKIKCEDCLNDRPSKTLQATNTIYTCPAPNTTSPPRPVIVPVPEPTTVTPPTGMVCCIGEEIVCDSNECWCAVVSPTPRTTPQPTPTPAPTKTPKVDPCDTLKAKMETHHTEFKRIQAESNKAKREYLCFGEIYDHETDFYVMYDINGQPITYFDLYEKYRTLYLSSKQEWNRYVAARIAFRRCTPQTVSPTSRVIEPCYVSKPVTTPTPTPTLTPTPKTTPRLTPAPTPRITPTPAPTPQPTAIPNCDQYKTTMDKHLAAYNMLKSKADTEKAEYLKYKDLYDNAQEFEDQDDLWLKEVYEKQYKSHESKYRGYKAEYEHEWTVHTAAKLKYDRCL